MGSWIWLRRPVTSVLRVLRRITSLPQDKWARVTRNSRQFNVVTCVTPVTPNRSHALRSFSDPWRSNVRWVIVGIAGLRPPA